MNQFKKRVLISAALLIGFTTYYVSHVNYKTYRSTPQSMVVETVYGSTEVTEPVVIELINSKAMQRLKKVHQYGSIAYIKPEQKYNRFEHSLGVFYLIRKFGGTVEEQVAGLLHDVSHTAFSHVADFLYDSLLHKKSYQDKIFSWYVAHTDVKAILDKHNMSHLAENGVCESYKILKDDLPSLCADRLEYNLYGGVVEGWMTEDELRTIVSHLDYRDNQWVFTNQESARKFADISIRLSVQNWCSHENAFVCKETAHLIKRGIDLGVITMDDLHFSYDEKVWNKLIAHNDEQMQRSYKRIIDHKNHYTLCKAGEHDIYSKGKYRGVDPLVLVDNSPKRLSELDPTIKVFDQQAHDSVKDGWYIKYV